MRWRGGAISAQILGRVVIQPKCDRQNDDPLGLHGVAHGEHAVVDFGRRRAAIRGAKKSFSDASVGRVIGVGIVGQAGRPIVLLVHAVGVGRDSEPGRALFQSFNEGHVDASGSEWMTS